MLETVAAIRMQQAMVRGGGLTQQPQPRTCYTAITRTTRARQQPDHRRSRPRTASDVPVERSHWAAGAHYRGPGRYTRSPLQHSAGMSEVSLCNGSLLHGTTCKPERLADPQCCGKRVIRTSTRMRRQRPTTCRERNSRNRADRSCCTDLACHRI